MSHFSAKVSGETPCLLDDDMELILTWSSNDEVKASTFTLGFGVGVFSFGLGGRGDLTLRTSRLSFFLVLISPFQFFIASSC